MATIGGFGGGSNKSEETDWTIYQGKPVIAQCNGIRVSGVVYDVRLEKGYVDFMPSLVPTGDDMRLETNVPTRLELGGNLLLAIRPLIEGDLEKEAEHHNARIASEKKRMASKSGDVENVKPSYLLSVEDAVIYVGAGF